MGDESKPKNLTKHCRELSITNHYNILFFAFNHLGMILENRK